MTQNVFVTDRLIVALAAVTLAIAPALAQQKPLPAVQVTLTFEDGSRARADALIGADGVHSLVRDVIVGPDMPIHKGRTAYRAIFPAALVGRDIGRSRTKWWGIDRHIVIYYTRHDRSERRRSECHPYPRRRRTALAR